MRTKLVLDEVSPINAEMAQRISVSKGSMIHIAYPIWRRILQGNEQNIQS
jgi:hypothetical protein